MKLLYVTNAWTTLNPVLYDGEPEIKGMPAFVKVLERLILEGHSVDLIFYDYALDNRCRHYKISLAWLKEVHILDHFFLKEYKAFAKIISQLIVYFKIARAVKRALKHTRYDFIYGHGPLAEAASHGAKKHNIPFGMRRYGDNFGSLIEKKGLFYALLSNPINYYSYMNKKSFMLATNDGSRIDKTYHIINNNKVPYDLHMWFNGYPQLKAPKPLDDNLYKKPFLLYAARIVSSKRQHLALDILKLLLEKEIKVNLYMVGQKDDQHYFNYLCQTARQHGLEDQLFYLGSVNKQLLQSLTWEALAALSLYENYNLGNVLIEYLTAGGLVISIYDGSLDGIIVNKENGFLVDNMEQAASIIEKLLSNSELRAAIKDKARETVKEKFLPWNERVTREIELIKSYSD